MRVLVISDLHIASGPLDDFDKAIEAELASFCCQIAAEGVPTELVINGDFLDFVQAEPWRSNEFESTTVHGAPLCFTEEQSLAKLSGIFRTHPDTFDALQNLLKSPAINRLTIMPGNHDADFFWEGVRDQMRARLAGKDSQTAAKLHFHLDSSYHPRGFPGLWIEHGHQHDPCNSFELNGQAYWSAKAPPVLPDTKGIPRLFECVGTRFLLKFLNDIDEKYPFVDNVKPFSKCLKMFFMSNVVPGFGPLKVSLSAWALVRFLGDRATKAPKDLMSSDQVARRMTEEMKRHIKELNGDQASKLTSRLNERGFALRGMPVQFFVDYQANNIEMLLDFLIENPAFIDDIEPSDSGMLSAGHKGYMTLGSSYLTDETAELRRAASRIIALQLASGVVMGHTHEAVNATEALAYVNTGSWTRYYVEKPGERVRTSWNLLKGSNYEHFPYELAYAELRGGPQEKLRRKVFRP
jgi:UDP-2,3-diacylglucosamine pyrophosphatase LpxH